MDLFGLGRRGAQRRFLARLCGTEAEAKEVESESCSRLCCFSAECPDGAEQMRSLPACGRALVCMAIGSGDCAEQLEASGDAEGENGGGGRREHSDESSRWSPGSGANSATRPGRCRRLQIYRLIWHLDRGPSHYKA